MFCERELTSQKHLEDFPLKPPAMATALQHETTERADRPSIFRV
jgi:hypothetical protein